jgi:hypothetical protein
MRKVFGARGGVDPFDPDSWAILTKDDEEVR